MLTVVFFLAVFFIDFFPGLILIFNLVFSYLWLVSVVFTAQDFTYSNSALAVTVEAFCFIALCAGPVPAKRGIYILTSPQLLPVLQHPLRLELRLQTTRASHCTGVMPNDGHYCTTMGRARLGRSEISTLSISSVISLCWSTADEKIGDCSQARRVLVPALVLVGVLKHVRNRSENGESCVDPVASQYPWFPVCSWFILILVTIRLRVDLWNFIFLPIDSAKSVLIVPFVEF